MIQRGYKVVVIINLLIFMAAMVGFITPSQKEWYYTMLPFYFVVSAIILMAFAKQELKKTAIDALFVILFSLLLEGITIYLGWIDYSYHWSFGMPIWPISMGFYWYALSYSTSVIVSKIPAHYILAVITNTIVVMGMHILVCIPLIKLELISSLHTANWVMYAIPICIAAINSLFLVYRKPHNNPLALYYLGGIMVFFCGLISFIK